MPGRSTRSEAQATNRPDSRRPMSRWSSQHMRRPRRGCTTSSATLSRRPPSCSSTTARGRRSPAYAGRRSCDCATTPGRRRRVTPGCVRPKRRSSRSSTRTSRCTANGSTVCSGTSTTHGSDSWPRASPADPPPTPATVASPVTRSVTRRSTSGRNRPASSPARGVSYVPAAALVVRKEALDEVGGFDETLRCGEDVDAVWRLAAAGWRGRYEPLVVVHHQPRRTWRQLAAQRQAYGESAAALAVLHGNAVAPVRMSPWTLGVWGLAAAGRPMSAAGLAGATALALIPKLPGVPAGESLRLAGTGHLAAAGALATAVRRVWLPLVGVGAVWSRHARWVAAASIAPAILRGGPARLLDDVAYGVGVWKGVLGRRRLAPLLPAVTSWPRREDVAALFGSGRRRRAAT